MATTTGRTRAPINIDPAVRDALAAHLSSPKYAGTGVGYSEFIRRAILLDGGKAPDKVQPDRRTLSERSPLNEALARYFEAEPAALTITHEQRSVTGQLTGYVVVTRSGHEIPVEHEADVERVARLAAEREVRDAKVASLVAEGFSEADALAAAESDDWMATDDELAEASRYDSIEGVRPPYRGPREPQYDDEGNLQ
jgi:hypothetical protein